MHRLRNKFVLFLIAVLSACSSSQKKDEGVSIPSLYAGPIQMRRPVLPSINPKEYPGSDVFSRAQEADDSKLECEPIDKLIDDKKLPMLLACLGSIKDYSKVEFQLLRHSNPEWVLQVNDDTPDCLVETMSYLPLPREVFFLADHNGALSCINARLDIERDESFDSIWSETETKMSVVMGSEEKPKNEGELKRLLKAWALSPFFGRDKAIHGKTVPKKMCQACFQNEQIFKTHVKDLPQWP